MSVDSRGQYGQSNHAAATALFNSGRDIPLLQAHGVKHVDLLLVDTEGYDFEIIKMLLNDSPIRPGLIRYEHLHLSPSDRLDCVELLAVHGYRMIVDGIDTIELRLTGSPRPDLGSRPCPAPGALSRR